jgi:hypothetical protein
MASVYTNVNMVAYNRKQIRAAAQNVGILHDNAPSTATLLAAVKAK